MKAETSLQLSQQAQIYTYTIVYILARSQHSSACLGAHTNEASVMENKTHDAMIVVVERDGIVTGSVMEATEFT